MSLPPSNPFSTRFIQPGASEYLFPPGGSLEQLLARLQASGWWGEIIGPHGSGKSSLLHALAATIAQTGRDVRWFSLRQGESGLPYDSSQEASAWRPASQIMIDGYEQLSWWSRWRLKRQVKRAGAGLLVTAHQSVGLPPLFETGPNLELLQALVQRLTAADPGAITPTDVAERFRQHRGDARETLFALYDLYQQRRS